MEYEYWVDQPRHGDFPLRILLQERLQNQPVRSHWHNAVEVLWVVEGALTLSNDGNEITLPKGSLGIIHSARLHSIAIASERARYHCMIIPRDVIEHEPIFTAPLPFVTRDPVCIQLYCRLLRLEQHRGLFPSQMAVSLLTQLLIELASLGGTQACIIATPMLSAVKEAMHYIETHYGETLTVEHIASTIGISRHHLCHIFKAATGITLSHYWQMVRCNVAREMIYGGSTAIQAADACGFSSYAHFSNVYYRIFEKRPSEYKKKRK